MVWGEGEWGDDWGAVVQVSGPPPEGPIPEAIKVNTIGGSARAADFGLGAYSNNGSPAYGNDFTAGDFVTIIGEVTPDPVDIGANGELYAAFASVIGGKVAFSFLNEDGNFETWDTTLGGLGPALIATPLEASHQVTIFEGNLQAGIYKFTFAYMADGGPLVFMKPVAIVVSE
jgi:hypothetical protein